MALVHVLNGDAFLEPFVRAEVPGDVVVFGEMLSEGPVAPDLRSVASEREAWFQDRLGVDGAAFKGKADATPRRLARVGAGDEVVLWFEEDLVCQVNLAWLLATRPWGHARASLAVADAHLGAGTSTEEVRRLFGLRSAVPEPRFELAKRAWAAYAAPDPSSLVGLLGGSFSAWPLLKRGLTLHLERFPSVRKGLDLVEEQALLALAGGDLAFPALVAAVLAEPRVGALGVTDLVIASRVEELAAASLVELTPGAEPGPRGWTVALAPEGRGVLAGDGDRYDAIGADRWVGGVRLVGAPAWRWDATAGALVRA